MGGNGAASGIRTDGKPYGKKYGSEYHTVLKSGKDRKAHNYFLQGFEEMQKQLNPIKVIVFTITNEFKKLELEKYKNIEYINCSVKGTF